MARPDGRQATWRVRPFFLRKVGCVVRIGDLVRAWWSNRFRPGAGWTTWPSASGFRPRPCRPSHRAITKSSFPSGQAASGGCLCPTARPRPCSAMLLERCAGQTAGARGGLWLRAGPLDRARCAGPRGPGRRVALDVVDFFPTTRSDRLQGYFRAIGWSAAAAQVLVRLTTHEGGLPQGAPTSPRLSNLVNRPLDVRLTNLAAKYRAAIRATRTTSRFLFRRIIRGACGGWCSGRRDPQRPGLHAPPRQEAEHAPPPPAPGRHRAGRERAAAIARALRRRLRAVEHRLRTGRAATLTPEQLDGWRALEAMIEKQCRPAE